MPAHNSPETAIYALTEDGARLGRRLADALSGRLYAPARFAAAHGATGFATLGELVDKTFHSAQRHVFIAATGIVVRVIAPLLVSKATDPAVVALDQQGRFAISLVSGHLGGANELACEIAAFTGGQAVITTATDTGGLPAVDVLARRAGLFVENPNRIKGVNAALLEGKHARVVDVEGWLGVAGPEWEAYLEVIQPEEARRAAADSALVWVDWRTGEETRGGAGALVLRPPCLCLGLGCRRGAPASAIEECIRSFFEAKGLALASLWRCGSVKAKRDEAGLLEAVARLGKELVFFSPEELNTVRTPNPSAKAAEAVGASSVSEAAALLLAQTGELMVEKTVCAGMTLALAIRSVPLCSPCPCCAS